MAEVVNLPCIKKETFDKSILSHNQSILLISVEEVSHETGEHITEKEDTTVEPGLKENMNNELHNNDNSITQPKDTFVDSGEKHPIMYKSLETYSKEKEEIISDSNLTCPYCLKKFEDKTSFKKHEEIHLGGWPFTCQVCHKGFLFHHLLETHAAYHKNEVFPCDTCDKKCVSRYKLKLHMRVHFNQFTCRICNESFKTKESLNLHKSCHKRPSVKKEIYVCKICSAKFPVHVELKMHQRMHATDWPFSCNVCKKLYRRKGSFLNHMSVCLGMNPYSCDICNKTFTRQRQFVQHVKEMHNGIRPFNCSICYKRFNSKSNLEFHSQVHSSRLPAIYKCSLCQQMFNSSRKLRGHKIREHSLYRPYKCNTCKKLFLFKSQLSNHSKEHKLKEL